MSDNTEKILAKRLDDPRIDIIHSLMFDNDMGGLHKDRKIILEDDKNSKIESVIRKAGYLDTLKYYKIQGTEIKNAIEQNIGQIQNLKANGQGMKGLPPIKDVWLFIFVIDDQTSEIKVNTYMNPNSQDIGDILRTDKQIMMAGFIITYNTVFEGQKLPAGYPSEVYEWSFVSPLFESNLKEYMDVTREFEKQQMKEMFFIDFDKALDNKNISK